MSTKMFFITADVTDGISHWNKSAVVCGSTITTAYNAFLSKIADNCHVTEYGYTQLKLTSMHAGDIITHDDLPCAVEKYKVIPTSGITEDDEDETVYDSDEIEDYEDDMSDDDESMHEAIGWIVHENTDAKDNTILSRDNLKLKITTNHLTDNVFTASDEYLDHAYTRYVMKRFRFAILPERIRYSKQRIEKYIRNHPKKCRYINVFVRNDLSNCFMYDIPVFLEDEDQKEFDDMFDSIREAFCDNGKFILPIGYVSKGLEVYGYLNVDNFSKYDHIPSVIY